MLKDVFFFWITLRLTYHSNADSIRSQLCLTFKTDLEVEFDCGLISEHPHSAKHVDRRSRLCAKNVLGAGYAQKNVLDSGLVFGAAYVQKM